MKNLLPILILLISSSAIGQFDIDLEFNYQDLLKCDSTHDFTTIKIYEERFTKNEAPYEVFDEELIFNKEGCLIERRYFCGGSKCETMTFEINEIGESIITDDTFELIKIPKLDPHPSQYENISLEYNTRWQLTGVIYKDPLNVEKLRLEYSYDSKGRIVECKRFYGGILKLITKYKYGT